MSYARLDAKKRTQRAKKMAEAPFAKRRRRRAIGILTFCGVRFVRHFSRPRLRGKQTGAVTKGYEYVIDFHFLEA